MLTSWRTSLMGVLAIIGAVVSAATALLDGDPLTQPDWATLSAVVATSLGLLHARDNKVSSVKAGVADVVTGPKP